MGQCLRQIKNYKEMPLATWLPFLFDYLHGFAYFGDHLATTLFFPPFSFMPEKLVNRSGKKNGL